MDRKPVFTDRDLQVLLSLIQVPDYSSVRVSEDIDYKKYAITLLKKFSIKMKEENIEKLGRFVARCMKANRANSTHLTEASDVILKRKVKLERDEGMMKRRVLEMKSLAEEDKRIKGDSVNELSPEGRQWAGKIRLIGTKSFKTVWYPAVKFRPDIVFTDEEQYRARVKDEQNRPVFMIPQSTFENIKRRFDKFEPGFYEYLEYLFYRIEEERHRVDPGYVADRTIFLLTTAPNINAINPNNDLVAINTYGHDRATYKGLPEFMTPDDVKKQKDEPPVELPQRTVARFPYK